MSKSDRRQFLKNTAAGLAGTSALGNLEPLAGNEKRKSDQIFRAAIPPHHAVAVPGTHGYAEKSVAAGDTIHFRVSSSAPYELEVCRLARDIDDSDSDQVLHSFPRREARQQPIHTGSYVHVENALPANQDIKAITLECWVRPWRLNASQGILSQHDHPDACGYGLFVDADGRVKFYLGDGRRFRMEWLHSGPRINHRRWTHVAGVWDGAIKTLWVNGRRVGSWEFPGPFRPGSSPIRLGAYGEGGAADHFLDGDIAMPVIYPRALTAAEVKQRIAFTLAYHSGVQLRAVDAKLSGPTVKINAQTNVAAWWSDARDLATWELDRQKPGKYDVFVTWGVPDSDANQPYAIELDGKVVITGRVASTGGYDQFIRIKIGEIDLERPTHRLVFRPADKIRNDLVDLQTIELVPQDGAAEEKPKELSIPSKTLACWPLMEESGDLAADVSGNRRDGRVINHGTWMVGGPSFNGATVGRYDSEYDPREDPIRGHALRLASDDIYDCRWDVTHEYRLAKDAKPGVYVGRIRYQLDGKPHWYHITFLVKKAQDTPKAPILVICSTSTWLAYNTVPFPAPLADGETYGPSNLPAASPQMPTYSCYADHRAGQPTYQLGMKMPWPAASPEVLYSPKNVGYSHLMRGELFLHRWLDDQGYDYDVVADHDLHRDPDLLKSYKTVLINGHSEYWSAQAYEGLDHYLQQGGTTIVLSGNTMFWRTSFNEECSIMECRKLDTRIGGRGGATVGELYHSHDKRRGSLMRECGYPAWKIIGLSCCGWGPVSAADDYGVYHLTTPEHFLLNEPDKVGLDEGDTFGHAPGGGLPRAIGHEWDVRVPTLVKITHHVPAGASIPDEPPGIITLATGKRINSVGMLDYFTANTRAVEDTCAEMIYWERPSGGRVFHCGAIGAGWALSADPKLQTLMGNVLHHFGAAPTTKTS